MAHGSIILRASPGWRVASSQPLSISKLLLTSSLPIANDRCCDTSSTTLNPVGGIPPASTDHPVTDFISTAATPISLINITYFSSYPAYIFPTPLQSIKNNWTRKNEQLEAHSQKKSIEDNPSKTSFSKRVLIEPPRYSRRFKFTNATKTRAFLINLYAGYYNILYLALPINSREPPKLLVGLNYVRYPVYPSLVPFQSIIDTFQSRRPVTFQIKMDDSEYMSGDESDILLATPTMMRLPSGMDAFADSPNPFEETPTRPRRSTRSQSKNNYSRTKSTKTPFSQQFMDIQNQEQGTLFEQFPTDSNMTEYLNFSPEKTAVFKTPALIRNNSGSLQTPKEFLFKTPAHTLRWGNDENRNPHSLSSNLQSTLKKTEFSTIDPRFMVVPDEGADPVGPITNAKSRSKPLVSERSPKRVCSGEGFSPVNGRQPLQGLEDFGNRGSLSTENQSSMEIREDDCVTIVEHDQNASEFRRRETAGLRQFSHDFRNFTAIDLSTLKSFSQKKADAIAEESPLTQKTSTLSPVRKEFTPMPTRIPQVVTRRRAHSDPLVLTSHINEKENLLSSRSKESVTSGYVIDNASASKSSPIKPASRIPVGSPQIAKKSTPLSVLRAPHVLKDLSPNSPSSIQKRGFLSADRGKSHRRSTSDPIAALKAARKHISPPKTIMKLEPGLPTSISELQALVLDLQSQLKSQQGEVGLWRTELTNCKTELRGCKERFGASNEALERALQDVEYANIENRMMREGNQKLIASQNKPTISKSSTQHIPTKQEIPVARTISAASSSTTTSRPPSSHGPAVRPARGQRAGTTSTTPSTITRPLSQAGSRAPPTRGGQKAPTTSSAMGSRIGASSSMGTRSGVVSSMGTRTATTSSSSRTPTARPGSALARNPVRRDRN